MYKLHFLHANYNISLPKLQFSMNRCWHSCIVCISMIASFHRRKLEQMLDSDWSVQSCEVRLHDIMAGIFRKFLSKRNYTYFLPKCRHVYASKYHNIALLCIAYYFMNYFDAVAIILNIMHLKLHLN